MATCVVTEFSFYYIFYSVKAQYDISPLQKCMFSEVNSDVLLNEVTGKDDKSYFTFPISFASKRYVRVCHNRL